MWIRCDICCFLWLSNVEPVHFEGQSGASAMTRPSLLTSLFQCREPARCRAEKEERETTDWLQLHAVPSSNLGQRSRTVGEGLGLDAQFL